MLGVEEEAMKLFVIVLAAALGAGPAAAADYPTRSVRIIVPFPPGATADSVGRILANGLAAPLGQPVVVDNKPGADGAIAAELTARSSPDGHTLFLAGNTAMLGIPVLRKNPPFDPLRDFTAIARVVRFAFFLVVHPGVPAKTVQELVDYARVNPGKLNYATGNVQGVLGAAQLMSLTGTKMVHVPYKGEPLAVPDLLDGRVHLMFATAGVAAPLVKDGKVRALATLLPHRSALLPAVPTVAEAGAPRLSVVVWAGFFGPANMPAETLDRISRETNALLKRPDVAEQLQKLGVEPSGTTPAEFAAFLKQQLADWGRAARDAGLQAE